MNFITLECFFYFEFHIWQICDVIHNKNVVQHFADEQDQLCRLLFRKWSTLLELQSLLQIPYQATIEVQRKNLCLSDTFGIWLNMQVLLSLKMKTCKTSFAKCLRDSVVARKKTIFDNPAMCAAVYLDPRYRKELLRNKPNHVKAIDFLAWLFNS